MNKQKKKMQQKLKLSMTNGRLDPRKIELIAKKMDRRELSEYYRLLVAKRAEEKVVITSAIQLPGTVAFELRKLFTDKEVFFETDPKIIAGLKVRFSDLLFNASLKDYLHIIKQQYTLNS